MISFSNSRSLAAFRLLGSSNTLTETVQYFVKHARPVGRIYTIQEAIAELIKDKEAAEKGQRHLNGLRWNLERIAEDFPSPINCTKTESCRHPLADYPLNHYE